MILLTQDEEKIFTALGGLFCRVMYILGDRNTRFEYGRVIRLCSFVLCICSF